MTLAFIFVGIICFFIGSMLNFDTNNPNEAYFAVFFFGIFVGMLAMIVVIYFNGGV